MRDVRRLGRREFLRCTGMGLAGLAPFTRSLRAADAAGKRPNIIFLLTDDQRNDTLGCAGHPIIKTPNIDRLAQQGTRFTNAFVTTSICAASRACIFTGLHERTHGYSFGTLPLSAANIATSYPVQLRQAGYRTGFAGKFGVGVPKGARDEMFDVCHNLSRKPYMKTLPDGSLRHVDEITVDRGIEFVRSTPRAVPFCLSLSFNGVHAEDSDKERHYPPPKAVANLYEGVEIPPPRLDDPSICDSQPPFLQQSLNRERYFWRWDTPAKYQKNMRNYFRMISGVDHAIGRLLKALDDAGLADNTVVIYSADNGYYMGDRGFAGKWSHYEESLRVPLIVHDPRLPRAARGRTSAALCLNLDIPATLLDFAGVDIPDACQGRTLVPLLSSPPPADWRQDFFCEHLMPAGTRIPKWEGVRGSRYVYARYFEQTPVYEFLHDLDTDPDQLRNLASEPAYADVLQQMRRRCDRLRDGYGGPYQPRPRERAAGTPGAAGFVDGVSGKAAQFDGKHSIDAGTIPALGRDDAFSWSFWISLPEQAPVPGVLIGNRRLKNGSDSRQFMKVTRETVQYYGSQGGSARIAHKVKPGRWVHVAVIKDRQTLTCWVDGAELASAPVPFDTPELPFYLGGDPKAGEFAVGCVDEVRLYRRALTATEVAELKQLGDVQEGLHLHVSFD